MKTIQMTIDDELLAEVDQLTSSLQITRSAFIRSALQLALRHHAILEKEQQHAQGYARHPVTPGEFDAWDTEQVWGEP
jgi:metal-responsive CopG/Arc/MetJ family transcriptional regulator